MNNKKLETMNQKELIQTIKESSDSWALLTANGFNLACEVSTDYPSLCRSLVESFSEELSDEEKTQFNKETNSLLPHVGNLTLEALLSADIAATNFRKLPVNREITLYFRG